MKRGRNRRSGGDAHLHILPNDDGIQLVALEIPPNEERPSFPENIPDDGHIEILASNDVRQSNTKAEEEPADSEIVNVRFVTWEEKDGLFLLCCGCGCSA
jgi:hypothetical protein